ncbi:MAG: CPBP family intramembrane metalloprotease [Bdellovibrionales bacterium]|nr:CPBP family intramembrane metalloprotease [Bdellovibrionales bacterium]
MLAGESLSKREVLILAGLSELFLVILSLVWIYFADLNVTLNASLDSAFIGAIATIPLILFNVCLSTYAAKNKKSIWFSFLHTTILPLCKNLDPVSALVVGIMAGIGEELFFRATVANHLILLFGISISALLSSLLFSLMHFGNAFLKLLPISLVYFCVGAYLFTEYVWSKSLLSVIVTHALYNWFAIIYLRSKFIESHHLSKSPS